MTIEEAREDTPENAASRQPDGDPPTGFGRRSFRHPDPIIRFTFGIYVFAGFLALFALLQLWAFAHSERAFVTFDAVRLEGGLQGGKPLVIALTVKNGGRAPATNVTIEYTSNIPVPAPNTRMVPAIAGGSTSTIVFRTGVPVRDDDVQAMRRGEIPLNVWGEISFNDGFFRQRRTEFCAVLDWEGGSESFVSC